MVSLPSSPRTSCRSAREQDGQVPYPHLLLLHSSTLVITGVPSSLLKDSTVSQTVLPSNATVRQPTTPRPLDQLLESSRNITLFPAFGFVALPMQLALATAHADLQTWNELMTSHKYRGQDLLDRPHKEAAASIFPFFHTIMRGETPCHH